MDIAHKVIEVIAGASLYTVVAVGCFKILSVTSNQTRKQ
jgi:hypothetical protein